MLGEGWELSATEAGRYAAGLMATLQARNGTLQACQQVPLAHPKKWQAFVQDVAERSGCATDAIVAAIHELTEAIEILLRPRRPTPADPTKRTALRRHLRAHRCRSMRASSATSSPTP